MLSIIRTYALRLLARREHASFELQQKLKNKGFRAPEVGKVVQELAREGLQSDSRFIENYITMRSQRGFGPVRIQAELYERGLDKEHVKNWLQLNDPAWLALAHKVRCKKFGTKIPPTLRLQTPQLRYLYYKGFTPEHIREIFNYEEEI